jgi:hypothetical protein
MNQYVNTCRLLTARAFVLGQMFAAAVGVTQDVPTAGSAPVSILRIAADDPANFGFRPRRPGRVGPVPSFGTTFLVTNHTSETLAINLAAIEVGTGSNWIVQMTPLGPLNLSAPDSARLPGATNAVRPGLTTTGLQPHQAAYATVQFSGMPTPSGPLPGSAPGIGMNYLAGQPTGAVWRVVVSVQAKLTGVADASARITRYPDMHSQLAANGEKNPPLNPFSSAYSYFGKPTRVVSQQVPAQ